MSLAKRLLFLLFLVVSTATGAIELVIPNDPDYQRHPEYLAPLKSLVQEPEFAELTLRISVGRGGLERALSLDKSTPLLSVFVWSSSYYSLIKQAHSIPTINSAIFADPDPIVQLELAKAFAGNKEQVGVIVNEQQSPALLRANRGSLKIESLVSDRKNLFKSLRLVTSGSSMFLAIPDPDLFNGETSGSVIETLFDQRKAVIGYSPGFVKAGALASVYSEPDDLTQQIREALNFYKKNKTFPAASFPKYFKVKTNERVARWLNYSVPEEGALLIKLKMAAEVNP